jgi:hypothetical protein
MPVGQTTNNILEQPRKKTLEEQISSISAEAKRSATRADSNKGSAVVSIISS